jgi:hypothetical protein
MPPTLMDEEDIENGSGDVEKKSEYSKESIHGSTIHEEDEKGLAITGLDDAKRCSRMRRIRTRPWRGVQTKYCL